MSVVNDFGWGINKNSLPEFKPIGEARQIAWNCAKEYAQRDEGKQNGFTWTGITIGNPIDWVSVLTYLPGHLYSFGRPVVSCPFEF